MFLIAVTPLYQKQLNSRFRENLDENPPPPPPPPAPLKYCSICNKCKTICYTSLNIINRPVMIYTYKTVGIHLYIYISYLLYLHQTRLAGIAIRKTRNFSGKQEIFQENKKFFISHSHKKYFKL